METTNNKKLNVQLIDGLFQEIKEVKIEVAIPTKAKLKKQQDFIFKYASCNILNIEASAIRTKGKNNIIVKKTKKYEGSMDFSKELTQFEKVYNSFKVGNETPIFYADAKGHKRSDLIINLKFNTVSNTVLINKDAEKQYDKDKKEIEVPFYDEDGEAVTEVELKISELRKNLYLNGFVATINGVKRAYRKYKRSCGSSREGNCIFVWENLIPSMMLWTNMGIPMKLHERNTPELDLPDFQLPQYEAYIALTMSSAIDNIIIPNNSIVILDDQFSVFTEKVMETKIIDTLDADGEQTFRRGECTGEDEKGKKTYKKELNQELYTDVNETFEVRNNLWDGMSLIEKSIMGKYSDKGFLLVRNNWIKSACFNSEIQLWFSEHGITTIAQLRKLCPTMVTLATEISQIKMLTTRSSLKIAKFPEIMDMETFLKKSDKEFSIIKHEKDTKFFNGDYVKTSYQLCQTLNMNIETELKSFLKPTTDYINELKKDDNIAFKNYLKMKVSNDIEDEDLTSNDEFMMTMLNKNTKFVDNQIFRTFKEEVIGKLKVEAKTGRILVRGTYATMVSCPILMLKYIIGEWKEGDKDVINPTEVICPKFNVDDDIAMIRSPHIVSGNLLLAKVVENDDVTRYMNLTKNIIVVSSVNNNICQILNSCDWDSDSALCTTSSEILSSVLRDYKSFLVPCTNIDGEKSKYKYCLEDMAKMDSISSNSQKLIGQIVNFSSALNSLMFDNINAKGMTIESQLDIQKQLCSLAIMSGLAIDGSKKTFSVDLMKELGKIRKNWGDKVKLDVLDKKGNVVYVVDEDGNTTTEIATKDTTYTPYFFKWLKEDKIDARRFKKYNSIMDNISKIIEDDVIVKGNSKTTTQLMQMMKNNIEGGRKDDSKIVEFIKDIEKLSSDSKQLFIKQKKEIGEEYEKNTKDMRYTKLDTLNTEFIDSHKNGLNAKTIEAILLTEGHTDNYKSIKRKLVNMMFLCNKKTFNSMFNIAIAIEDVKYLVRLDNINNWEELVYTDKDIIELYGIKFLIVTTCRDLKTLNENLEPTNYANVVVKSADKVKTKLKNV